MIDFLFDPIVLVSVGVGIVAVAGWFFISRGGGGPEVETISAFVFNRNHSASMIEAKTFDGLVTYGSGGFVENAHCILPVYFGRGGYAARDDNPNAPRGRYYAYLTRPGDGAPLDARNENFTPDTLSKSRFDSFAAISAERAVNRGKLDAAKGLLSERLLAIGAFLSILMVVITWSIVIVLPLTPLVVKSGTAPGSTPLGESPGTVNQDHRPIP